MSVDDLLDTLPRERFFPESDLDVVEDARMSRVRLVKDVLEREIGLPEPVAEVLSENPAAVCDSVSTISKART